MAEDAAAAASSSVVSPHPVTPTTIIVAPPKSLPSSSSSTSHQKKGVKRKADTTTPGSFPFDEPPLPPPLRLQMGGAAAARSTGPAGLALHDEPPRKRTIRPPTRDLPDESQQQHVSKSSRSKQPMSEWMRQCSMIVRELMGAKCYPHSWPFCKPVDTKEYRDYLDIIKVPMDLSKVRERIEMRAYTGPAEFARDVRLIFTNCYKYNSSESDVVKMARRVQVRA